MVIKYVLAFAHRMIHTYIPEEQQDDCLTRMFDFAYKYICETDKPDVVTLLVGQLIGYATQKN